jgi:hypothetical protein
MQNRKTPLPSPPRGISHIPSSSPSLSLSLLRVDLEKPVFFSSNRRKLFSFSFSHLSAFLDTAGWERLHLCELDLPQLLKVPF